MQSKSPEQLRFALAALGWTPYPEGLVDLDAPARTTVIDFETNERLMLTIHTRDSEREIEYKLNELCQNIESVTFLPMPPHTKKNRCPFSYRSIVLAILLVFFGLTVYAL